MNRGEYESDKGKNGEKGFTLVEVIVTLVLVGIFLALFFQTALLLESQRVSVVQQAKANDIAYSNLHKVSSRTALVGQVCTATIVSNGWDLTALGYILDTEPRFTSTLRAYPANGCTNFEKNPIRVVSTTRYILNSGGTENAVVHASYIR